MSKCLVVGRVVSVNERSAKIEALSSKFHKSGEVIEVLSNECLNVKPGDYVLISGVMFRKFIIHDPRRLKIISLQVISENDIKNVIEKVSTMHKRFTIYLSP